MALSVPDAFTSLALTLGVAYVPHAIRGALVHAKLGAMKKAGAKVPGSYDIRNPRTACALATDDSPAGVRIAAMAAAHNNALENFSFIAAGVLAARFAKVDRPLVDSLAAAYLGLRALYVVLYYYSSNKAVAGTRSLVWLASVAVPIFLLVAAAKASA